MALKKILIQGLNNAYKLASAIEEIQFGSSKYQDRIIKRRWGIGETGKLVGRTAQAITDAENSGKLPPAERNDNGRRLGYTIYQIDTMRTYFGTHPHREDNDEPIVFPVVGHKGGGQKTALAVHLSQYLALQGYSVLLADHDPQGTATLYHGYSPMAVPDKDTLLPWYLGEKENLDYAITKTYWPGLDIIKSNASVDKVKLELATLDSQEKLPYEAHLMLHGGLGTIKHKYDFIIVDAPPDLSSINVNLLFAADVVLMPTPASFADYMSTIIYFEMLIKMIDDIEDEGFSPDLKMVITHMDPYPKRRIKTDRKLPERQSHVMDKIIRKCFRDMVLKNTFRKTEEVPKAQLKLRTIFEQAASERSSSASYNGALSIFEPLFEEILNDLLLPRWASMRGE